MPPECQGDRTHQFPLFVKRRCWMVHSSPHSKSLLPAWCCARKCWPPSLGSNGWQWTLPQPPHLVHSSGSRHIYSWGSFPPIPWMTWAPAPRWVGNGPCKTQADKHHEHGSGLEPHGFWHCFIQPQTFTLHEPFLKITLIVCVHLHVKCTCGVQRIICPPCGSWGLNSGHLSDKCLYPLSGLQALKVGFWITDYTDSSIISVQ